MADKKNNLALWERVQETNPFYTKPVGYGAIKFTSINAQYQLKLATEEFGVYGECWGIKEIKYQFIDIDVDNKMALAEVIFFAGKSEFPISSSIMYVSKGKADDEFAKKLETDITTKALSKLGFNADVFLGRYDDNRYVNNLKQKFGEVPKKEISEKIYNEVITKIANADAATLKKMTAWASDYNDNEYKTKISELIKGRKSQI